ncbi:MAG: 50S ribosomal protein L5 [Proteobacteria bacterium]|nr:50S ribosomal protein L5 [Pseudomonadota bacterium]MBQ4358708.1 50S ribosomal protein L5 [Pseudomonadota bacterium]
MTRLYDRYINEAVPALKKEFGYSNPMEIPRLEKVVLNVGLGDAVSNAKLIEVVCNEIAAISGQKPVVTKAKKSIASFKLRQGMPIGVMVTLRRDRMFEFLDRLMNIALPRVRDFRGVSAKAFDGKGNYTLGVREHIIFPEIQIDKIEKVYGLNICVVTSARTDDEARALLKYLGMPFKK